MAIFQTITEWANTSQGLITLLTFIVTVPPALVLLYKGYRRICPSKREREACLENEMIHSQTLKKEIESRVKWDEQYSYYGEFLLLDIERSLSDTDESKRTNATPCLLVVLTNIHNDYIEFTTGSSSACHIKKIGDVWYSCNKGEESAILVEAVHRLPYKNIAIIRWDTNECWRKPQVCCRSMRSNKFPFTRIYYAQEADFGARKILCEVCLARDVKRKPKEFE
ncbi:MAG: hypothetical protein LBM04_07965 [Opitutaceae bacterium]|jgi:hypothetical protein|nr:hypothetical protein [Opitutaceae bacterium]